MLDNIVANLIRDLFYNNPEKRNKVNANIDEYIVNQYNKFRYTKNSLFRDEPIDFYKNFVPLTLQSESLDIKSDDPVFLLNQYKHIVIIGNAGSGKTTILRHVALKLMQESHSLPVSLDLRSYNSLEVTFEDFVAKQISKEFFKDIKSLFGQGAFTFIMDGFDEIRYDKDESYIMQIQDFVNKYKMDKFIVSSRPGTNVQSLIGFYVFYVNGLDNYSIHFYIDKLLSSSNLRKKIVNNLVENDQLKNILTSPLLVSLYVSALNNNIDIPNKKSVYFRNVLDSLLSKHDSVSKLGYVRERLSGLSKDDIESVATILAFRALSTSKYQYSKDEIYGEFQIIRRVRNLHFESEKLLYDLLITVNILVEDGFYYSFQHILLLEYLAALFISRLDEAKVKFYQKMVGNTQIKISLSFIEFINELDHSAFIKNYYIPMLEILHDDPYSQQDNLLAVKRFTELTYIKGDRYGYGYLDLYELKELIDRLRRENLDSLNNNFDELFGI